MLPDGSFGKQWLIVTGEQLHVFTESDSVVEERYQLPLKELTEPKAENYVGGGAFEVAQDGNRLELVRYTNARAGRFASAAGLLEKWLKGEEAEVPEEEQSRCPTCGLPREKGSKVCPACLPKTRTLRRLVAYLWPHWKCGVALSSLAFVSTVCTLVPPYLNKPLMDRVFAPANPAPLRERLALLTLLVLVMLGLRVASAVILTAQSWLSAWLGNNITHDIRCQLYRHLQYLSLSFFDKRQVGSVISRVNQDTGQLQQFLVWGAQDLSINVLQIFGIGVMLFVLNWKLALFVILPAPLVAVISFGFRTRIHYYYHRFFHRWSRVNAVLNESLTGLKIIKAFAQEPREITRFNERSYDLALAGVQAERMWATLFSGLSLLIMSGTLLVWFVGGREVLSRHGHMTLGTLMTFIAYVGIFYGPVQFLSMLLNWSARAMTASERVFEVLDIRPEVEEQEAAKPMPNIAGRVEFRDVSFGYEAHRPVLKKVSFDVQPDEMIGFVGHSGAGKTTTINLLCRFYDATEGQILIDGVPIRDIRLEDLRRQIGLVPQDAFLFSGTIADNIAYAKPGATWEEIIRAAKIANAHDFIRRKPDGYETMIGESGQGISAGEKQRLAIARAVLHNPRILILDEATSQVDVETEKQIQDAIERLVRGRTTFAIAHRLSTLKNADRLIVLKNGEITEMGTHDELMEKEDGEFKKLVQTYQEISKVHALQR